MRCSLFIKDMASCFNANLCSKAWCPKMKNPVPLQARRYFSGWKPRQARISTGGLLKRFTTVLRMEKNDIWKPNRIWNTPVYLHVCPHNDTPATVESGVPKQRLALHNMHGKIMLVFSEFLLQPFCSRRTPKTDTQVEPLPYHPSKRSKQRAPHTCGGEGIPGCNDLRLHFLTYLCPPLTSQ